MQHFSIKQRSSKLQGDFSVQQFQGMCNQKGIVFRILYVTILLSNAVLIFLVSFSIWW